MATHDYVIDNSTGANVRADINNALAAIVSNNSSSSQPTTRYAYMWWADTTNGVLKIRNSANDGWVELLQLDGTLTLEAGSATTPALAFRSDLNTGIYQDTNDEFNISCGGVERLSMGGSNTVFNETGADVDFRIEGDSTANLFVCDAGNNRVGIGTGSPRRHFHIHEAASATVGMMLTNGATGESNDSQGFQFKVGSDGTANIDQRENAAIKFFINGNDAMMIDTSRRLLIGKTSGSFALDVGVGSSSTLRLTNTLESSHGSHDANLVAGGTYYQNLTIQGRSLKLQTFNDNTVVNAMTVNPDQRVLCGDFFTAQNHGGATAAVQIQGTDHQKCALSLFRYTADDGGSRITLGKSRSSSGGGVTKLNTNDTCGQIFWIAANNNDVQNGFMASIEVQADAEQGGADTPGRMIFKTAPDGSSTLQERMRLDRFGNLCFGETGEPAAGSDGIRLETNGTFKQSCTGTGERNVFEFKNANGVIGKIVTQNSNTTFSTSSDYRLKENVVAISDGITRLKQLKPSRFNFIAKKDITQDGFLAHEVQSVVPEAISGEKDAVKEDGSIDPQGIDQGRLVPLLVAAVQELITKVETLEAA